MADTQTPYVAKDFSHLKGLRGISDQTLDTHLALYAGYVKATNALNARLAELTDAGQPGSAEYAELKRRLGFEYNGMRLHELYFENLTSGSSRLRPNTRLARAIAGSFGSVERWREDFSKIGTMRGVGWAVLFQDPVTRKLSNHWITLHEEGNVAGFIPVLVMDVWEHAWLLDYKPGERARYVEAFFSNIDWSVVNRRLRR
jgi:Fe-Mn family superoxide dismutase